MGPDRGWAFPGCNSIPLVGETDCKGRSATCSSYKTSCATNCPSLPAANVSGCDGSDIIGCSDWISNVRNSSTEYIPVQSSTGTHTLTSLFCVLCFVFGRLHSNVHPMLTPARLQFWMLTSWIEGEQLQLVRVFRRRGVYSGIGC